jgi:hypothetical protein
MKGHARFVAVAGLLPSGKAVDANLRKLQIDVWVVCANVRACNLKIVRPSVLVAMSQVPYDTTDRAFRVSCSAHHVEQLT